MGLPIEPGRAQVVARRVGETAPARDMDCDEPAVVRDSTAQQCGRPTSEDTGSHTAQPRTSSLLPLELSGVPSMRIGDCLAWLAGHTHFDPAQTRATLCSLYALQPLMLLSGDTFAACDSRHDSLCELLRRTYGADSLPRDSYGLSSLTAVDLADLAADAECAVAPARPRQRPAIPLGFERRDTASLAAQHDAQTSLTGLPAVHRSARVSQPAGKWWIHQPPQQQEHRKGI